MIAARFAGVCILVAGVTSCSSGDGGDGPPTRIEAVATSAATPIERVPPIEIRVRGCRLTDDLATGFAIGSGRVVTVAHVVRGSKTQLAGGRRADVIALDLRADVAILQVDGGDPTGATFATASIDDRVTMHARRDDAPVQLAGTVVRTPLIQFEEPTDRTVYDRRGLFIDGDRIVKGDSGSPVVDADGNVVGMVFATGREQARAYAVNSAEIEALIPAPDAPPVPTGKC